MLTLRIALLITMALLVLVAAYTTAQGAPTTAALVFYQCGDFDGDGSVSIEEVYEEAAYFGTVVFAAQPNGAGLVYDFRHDLRLEVRVASTVPEIFNVNVGDILVAVRQHFEGC